MTVDRYRQISSYKCSSKYDKITGVLRDGPKGHRVLIIHGSLNNSRFSISENILNQVEVDRGVAEGTREARFRVAALSNPG